MRPPRRLLPLVLALLLVLACNEDPSRPIDVGDPPDDADVPTAVIGSPQVGATVLAGDPLAFDGSASEDPVAGGLVYTWLFGDGTRGGGAQVAHIYGTAGNYSASLIVTDAQGAADTAQVSVQVDALPPASSTGTISGQVVDPSGNPVSDARIVRDGTELATTDIEGRALITGFPAGVPVALEVSADGYTTEVVRIEMDAALGQASFTAGLRPRNAAQAVDAGTGGTLSGEDGAEITLPPDGLVHSDGTPVTGDVEVAITPVDVSGGERAAFPGAFSGITPNGGTATLGSLGVVEFVLLQAGEEVQLAPGATAEVLLPIYTTGAAAGDEIPVWSLDEQTGIWIQEGLGEVVNADGGLALRATVGHLSWWNADKDIDVIEVYFSCEGYASAKGLPIEACRLTANTADDGPAWANEETIPESGRDDFLPSDRTIGFTGRASVPGCILTGELELEIPASGLAEPVTLLMNCTEDTATRIEYGYRLQQDLAAGEVHAFTWTGTAGDEVRLDLVEGGPEASYELFDPEGNVVAQGNFGPGSPEYLFADLTLTGDYRLIVYGRDALESGTYTLGLLRYEPAPPVELGTLTEGQSYSADLDFLSEVDVYRFDGTAGQPFGISASRALGSVNPLQADLDLVAPDGSVLHSEVVGAGVEGRWIPLPETGTYEVRMRARAESGLPGRYVLRLDPLAVSALSPNSSAAGAVVDPLRLQALTATFTEAGEVRFDVETAPDAGRLEYTLFDPAGAVIATGVPGAGEPEHVFVDVPAGGVGQAYRVQLHGLTLQVLSGGGSRDVGAYTLTAATYTPDDPVAIAIGGSATGDLGFSQELDVYTFDGLSGDQIRLTVRTSDGSALRGSARLLAPSGAVVDDGTGFTPATPAGIDAVLDEDGTYRIEITPAETDPGIPGSYEVEVRRTGGPTPISLGAFVEGAVDFGGEVDEYPFDGVAGQWVVPTVGAAPASSLDGLLKLIAPDGTNLLATSFEDGDRFYGDLGPQTTPVELPATGEYRLQVTGRTGFSTGAYFLILASGVGRTELDFGQNGFARMGSFPDFQDAAVDGDEVVVIDDRTDLFRFDDTGQLVASFGNSGQLDITVTLGSAVDLFAQVVEVQSDGGILLAGQTADSDLFAARLDATGTPDASFGTNGLSIVPLPDRLPRLNEAMVVADGADEDLLVGGYTGLGTSRDEVLLARFNGDGTVETAFGGGDGIVIDAADISVRGAEFDLQSDGRIVVASTHVRRYLSDGTLDTSFGAGGVELLDGLPVTEDIVVLADDRIVVVGEQDNTNGDSDVVVTRLLADGGRDGAFGGQGALAYDLGLEEFANTVAVDAAGRLLVGGLMSIPGFSGAKGLILSIEADGSLESGFGADGFALSSAVRFILWMELDASGRMVVAETNGISRQVR